MAQGGQTDRVLNFERTTYQVTCLCCGRTFTAKRSDATYCSAACRQRARRAVDGRQQALEQLAAMARRTQEIAATYADSGTVLAQMTALYMSIGQSLEKFKQL